MEDYSYSNVTIAEQYLRTIIGMVILFSYLTAPVIPAVFAFFVLLSLYLLATALVAWDPVYAVIYKIMSWFPKAGKSVRSEMGLYA